MIERNDQQERIIVALNLDDQEFSIQENLYTRGILVSAKPYAEYDDILLNLSDLIKESDNSQLEFVSNGKRIVKITRVTYVNGETKMEKIQVTPEMIELLNKNVDDQRYLLY